jgi:hypothetical protein
MPPAARSSEVLSCFGVHDVGEADREVTSMERSRYDVVPEDGGWAVESGGKSTPPFPSKELAISAATRRAEQDSPAEVIVHSEDGTVRKSGQSRRGSLRVSERPRRGRS